MPKRATLLSCKIALKEASVSHARLPETVRWWKDTGLVLCLHPYMTIMFSDAHLVSIADLVAFLASPSAQGGVEKKSMRQRAEDIRSTLTRFRYGQRKRSEKAVVRRYLGG